MTAQPIHQEPDPRDPEVILNALPEPDRQLFLGEYRAAAEAATHEVWRYKELQALLHRWSLVVIAVNKPGYREAMEQARNWRDHPESFTPIEQIAPDWDEQLAAAAHRQRER